MSVQVGLLACKSEELRREGTFIGIFLGESRLCFEGCVELRVLAGLINVAGHVLKPSSAFTTLHSPLNHPALSLTPVSSSLEDPEFDPYLAPFRSGSLHYHSSRSGNWQLCKQPGCCVIDLPASDVASLDTSYVTKKAQAALVLLRPLATPLTSVLTASNYPTMFKGYSKIFPGFQIVQLSARSKVLSFPPVYDQLAWDILSHPGATVMVGGPSGTGKSTLCRFLINYLLNRCKAVAYLECDVGQPEFTVPGVLSLHVLRQPIFGPPFTHLRTPERAYFHGDKSPHSGLELYLRAISALHRRFTGTVCKTTPPDTPLVINTCGWLHGIGALLFLDLIRLLSPSHIVRLRGSGPSPSDALPPITAELLLTRDGILTKSGATPTSGPDHTHLLDYREPSPVATEGGVAGGSNPAHQDEGEEFSDVEVIDSSSDEEGEGSTKPDGEGGEGGGESGGGVTPGAGQVVCNQWRSVLKHSVFTAIPHAHNGSKNSQQLRKLAVMSYFSPLVTVATTVAMEMELPKPELNFLSYAPPLSIPWGDVAVHVLHQNVPRSQVLYALNGRYVCLGRVEPSELLDVYPEAPPSSRLKFLKSRKPLIQFIGLGLVRGIDPVKKLFYIVTPEQPDTLALVNTLVLGNSESPDLFYPDMAAMRGCGGGRWPYFNKDFKPTVMGNLKWKQ